MFYPKPKNLIEKTRFYIREGDALYWDQKKGKRTLCYLFLFNDCMLLAKKQPDLAGHKYNLKYFITLNSSGKLEHGKEPVEFRLHLKTMSLIFFVRSSEEKNLWLSDINASIKGIHVSNHAPSSVQPSQPRESKPPSQSKERSASKGQMSAPSSKDKMRQGEPPHNPPQPKKRSSQSSKPSSRHGSSTSNQPRTRPPSEKQPEPQSRPLARKKPVESSSEEETSSEYETTSEEASSSDASGSDDALPSKDERLPLIQPEIESALSSNTPFAFTMPAFSFDLSPSTQTSAISNFSGLSIHDDLPPSDLPATLPSPTSNPFTSAPNPFTSSSPLTKSDGPPSYVPPSLQTVHQQQFDNIFGLPPQQNVNPFASPIQPAPTQVNPFFANTSPNPFKTGQ